MSVAVVARGKLKVDARRAALKLKDHLLADPSTWLCEVIRAAGLARATRVSLRYDREDLFVRCDGDAWPTDVLDRAASEVENAGGRAAEGRRARRLAIGALAALGHEAKSVTVFVRVGQHVTASRIDRATLQSVSSERDDVETTPADGGEVESLCVHVRRVTSWNPLSRFVDAGPPAEIEALRARLTPRAIPIFVNGERLVPADVAHAPLLSIPVGGSLEATIEVHRGWQTPSAIAFHEQGLLLTREETEISPALTPIGGVHAPILVAVWGDEIPTNVSRSKVREDVSADIAAAVKAALPGVIEQLRAAVVDAEEKKDAGRRADLVECLGAFAAVLYHGENRAPGDVGFRVLEMPLLWDVCGRPKSFRDFRHMQKERAYVRAPAEPLPAEAVPLVKHMYTATSEVQRRFFQTVSAADFASVEAEVRRGIERRRRALATPRVPLELPVDPARHLVVEKVDRSDGLRIVVALVRPSVVGTQSTFRCFVDGHLIEMLSIPWEPGTLPIDCALEWPSVLSPTPAYGGVRHDSGLQRSIHAAIATARLVFIERFADAPEAMRSELRGLLASVALGPEPDVALLAAPVWPVLGGARMRLLSTQQLLDVVKTQGGLRFVSPEVAQARKEVGYGGLAPVLVLEDRDAYSVREIIRADVPFVRYDAWVDKPRSTKEDLVRAVKKAIGTKAAPVVVAAEETLPFAVAAAFHGSLTRMHRGEVWTTSPSNHADRDPTVAVAIDEDYLLPGVDPLHLKLGAPDVAPKAIEILRAHLLDHPDLEAVLDASPATRSFLLKAMRPAPDAARLGDVLRFKRVQGGDVSTTTLAEVQGRASSSGPIRYISPDTPPPASEVMLVLDPDELEMLNRVFVGRLRKWEPNVSQKKTRSGADAFLGASSPFDRSSPLPGALAGAPQVPFARGGATPISGAMSVASDSPCLTVSVVYDGRIGGRHVLDEVLLPITAVVHVSDESLVAAPREPMKDRLASAVVFTMKLAQKDLVHGLLVAEGFDPFFHEPSRRLIEVAVQQGILSSSTMQRLSVEQRVALQQLRRGRADADPMRPRLSGQPTHRHLRVSVVDLDVTECAGEIEIWSGGVDVTLSGPVGERLAEATVPWLEPLGLGLRANLRFGDVEANASSVLDSAVRRHVLGLAPHASLLPSYVRQGLGYYALYLASTGQEVPVALARADVFSGGSAWFSLDALRVSKDVSSIALRWRAQAMQALGMDDRLPSLAPEVLERSFVRATVADAFDVAVLTSADRPKVALVYAGTKIAEIGTLLGHPVSGFFRIDTLLPDEAKAGSLFQASRTAIEAQLAAALIAAIEDQLRPEGSVAVSRFVDVRRGAARYIGWVWLAAGPAGLIRVQAPALGYEVRRSVRSKGGGPDVALGGALLATAADDDETDRAREVVAMISLQLADALGPPRRPEPAARPPSSRPEAVATEAPDFAPPRAREVEVEPAAAAPPVSDGPRPPTILDGLLAVFGVHRTWTAPANDPFVTHLREVMRNISIPLGTPFAFSEGGRPIRCERGKIVINRAHRDIALLIERQDGASLAAALISEVNREHANVTDAEELREVSALLLLAARR